MSKPLPVSRYDKGCTRGPKREPVGGEVKGTGITIKGKPFYLVIDQTKYEYNGFHDWEQLSRWFFDCLVDYQRKNPTIFNPDNGDLMEIYGP